MKEFYVTLMSKASTAEFPDNKANSFKNRLPHPLTFDDKEWKVGLASISYPIPPARPLKRPLIERTTLTMRISCGPLKRLSGHPMVRGSRRVTVCHFTSPGRNSTKTDTK